MIIESDFEACRLNEIFVVQFEFLVVSVRVTKALNKGAQLGECGALFAMWSSPMENHLAFVYTMFLSFSPCWGAGCGLPWQLNSSWEEIDNLLQRIYGYSFLYTSSIMKVSISLAPIAEEDLVLEMTKFAFKKIVKNYKSERVGWLFDPNCNLEHAQKIF